MNEFLYPRYNYKGTDILKNILTECVLYDDEGVAVARGISICAVLDHHNKKKARSIALGRAKKAYKTKESSAVIQPVRKPKANENVKIFISGDREHRNNPAQ